MYVHVMYIMCMWIDIVCVGGLGLQKFAIPRLYNAWFMQF